MVDLSATMRQAEFGDLVGISQQAVSEFLKHAALGPGVSAGEMLRAYCERLREQAAGRGSDGGLDLVQERAALAREQRIAQALKNAVTRREFAPMGLLTEVLASASQSVAAKLDALPGALMKVAPDMSDAARDAIVAAIARARNDWVADTAKLEVRVDPELVPEEDPEELFVPEDDI